MAEQTSDVWVAVATDRVYSSGEDWVLGVYSTAERAKVACENDHAERVEQQRIDVDRAAAETWGSEPYQAAGGYTREDWERSHAEYVAQRRAEFKDFAGPITWVPRDDNGWQSEQQPDIGRYDHVGYSVERFVLDAAPAEVTNAC